MIRLIPEPRGPFILILLFPLSPADIAVITIIPDHLTADDDVSVSRVWSRLDCLNPSPHGRNSGIGEMWLKPHFEPYAHPLFDQHNPPVRHAFNEKD